MNAVLREPLVHFLILGGLVFGLEAALASPDRADPHVIVVDRAVQVEVERQLAESLGRVPEPAEVDTAVEAWIHTEVLVREALALGLERDDPIVRERLAEKMRFVLGTLGESDRMDRYEIRR